MREWIGIVSTLLEKHGHHRKHHTDGVRYGFFPRMGIYACSRCGAQSPIAQSGSHCPSCGGSSAGAAVCTGGAAPAGGSGAGTGGGGGAAPAG